MKRIQNPFVVLGYEGPDYFCDREIETQKIQDGIEANRNINMVSIRRLGKTALMQHVFQKLDRKKFITIFVDLEYTQSQFGLLERLSESISAVLHNRDKSFLNTLIRLSGMIGASITVDPFSGIPKLDLGFRKVENVEKPLRALFDVLDKLDQIIIIALDEFQQINSYPETNTEALLRSIAQQYSSIRFIYAGSSTTLMNRMFSDPNKPFYQSVQPILIDYIKKTEYKKFIYKHFEKKGLKIEEDESDEILDWCRNHTYYVQAFCSRLYSYRQRNIKVTVNDIRKEMLEENKSTFVGYMNLVKTNAQMQLLKSIANFKKAVHSPLSNEFVQFSGLSAATIQSGLKRLENSSLILKDIDGYLVYNVFFSRFLELLK